jgi:hypothetical protein
LNQGSFLKDGDGGGNNHEKIPVAFFPGGLAGPAAEQGDDRLKVPFLVQDGLNDRSGFLID